MIKVLIIDKDLKTRSCLSKKLALFEGVTVVAQASTIQKGISAIEETDPDLVFLEVEMPEKNGFQILKKIPEINFEIVFMCKVADHAIEAIRHNALDYVVKPPQMEDIEEILKRYHERLELKRIHQRRTIKEKIHSLYDPSKKILLPTPKGYKLMNVDDIVYCESSGRYTIVRPYGEKSITIAQNLGSFEDGVSMHGFIRIHDSFMINIQYLDSYNRDAQKYGEVHLTDGTKLKVSRTRRSELLSVLKGFKISA